MEKIFRTKDGKEFTDELDAHYHEKTLESNKTISVSQQIVFDLIKQCRFNGFDGPEIVNFLQSNREMWIGVIPEMDNITLRDIAEDFYTDTVLVRCKDEETARLFQKKIKKELCPDECSVESTSSRDSYKNIIRMWWD